MPAFKVRRYTQYGVPEAKLHDVIAETEQAAAEALCGRALTRMERPDLYRRAEVRRASDLEVRFFFYELG